MSLQGEKIVQLSNILKNVQNIKHLSNFLWKISLLGKLIEVLIDGGQLLFSCLFFMISFSWFIIACSICCRMLQLLPTESLKWVVHFLFSFFSELSAAEEAELNSPELTEKDLAEEDLSKYIRTPQEVKEVEALMRRINSSANQPHKTLHTDSVNVGKKRWFSRLLFFSVPSSTREGKLIWWFVYVNV